MAASPAPVAAAASVAANAAGNTATPVSNSEICECLQDVRVYEMCGCAICSNSELCNQCRDRRQEMRYDVMSTSASRMSQAGYFTWAVAAVLLQRRHSESIFLSHLSSRASVWQRERKRQRTHIYICVADIERSFRLASILIFIGSFEQLRLVTSNNGFVCP